MVQCLIAWGANLVELGKDYAYPSETIRDGLKKLQEAKSLCKKHSLDQALLRKVTIMSKRAKKIEFYKDAEISKKENENLS